MVNGVASFDNGKKVGVCEIIHRQCGCCIADEIMRERPYRAGSQVYDMDLGLVVFTEYDSEVIGHLYHINRLDGDILIKLLAFLINMEDDFFHASLKDPKHDKGIVEGRRDAEDLMEWVSKEYPLLFLQYHLGE